MSSFKNKQGKVIVIDSSGPIRSIMNEVVRTVFGFTDVEARPSMQEALSFLEVDPVSWILTPLGADQPVNAMHLLKLCTQYAQLRNTRISFVLEETEQYWLQPAFEFGLLSWHRKPFTRDSLKDDLTKLLNALTEHDYNETLVAADYLRQELKKSASNHEAEIEFARNLLQFFPGNTKVLLSMVEPLFHSGQQEAAQRTLASAKLLNPKMTDKIQEIGVGLFGPSFKVPDASTIESSDINMLGIDSAIIVDRDETVAIAVVQTLNKLGVKNVQHITNGAEAAKVLAESQEPGLIIMEWKISGLSASALLQRIRSQGFINVPIVILSSLLQSSDTPLVREMGVASVITKPFSKDTFVPSVIAVMQQERLPTEAAVLERKFRAFVEHGKLEEAKELREKIFSHKQVSQGKRKLIDAEWAYANAKYQQAIDFARDALKSGNETCIVLNLLGKAFMRLSNFENALKCFERAKLLSPDNIERLVNIAESHAELGNDEAALEAINSAANVDAASTTVRDGSLKVSLAIGDMEAAKSIMATIQPIDGMIAYMNNKAVAYARCNMVDNALHLYQSLLISIPEHEINAKSLVSYNLALGLARKGQLKESHETCAAIIDKIIEPRVSKKTRALMQRLESAIKYGIALKLNTASIDSSQTGPQLSLVSDSESSETDNTDGDSEAESDHAATFEVKRGDLCCFLIFKSFVDERRVTELFAKPPRFKKRSAIKREETMGDAKLNKNSR